MLKRLTVTLALAFLGLFIVLSHFVIAQDGGSGRLFKLQKISVNPPYAETFVQKAVTETTRTFPYNSYGSSDFFFPPYSSDSDRMGYGKSLYSGDMAALYAGWYVDWNARINPTHPGGAEYARIIYFSIHDTGIYCGNAPAPATEASQVTATFTGTALIENVRANPGALWLIGNEPDTIYNHSSMKAELYAELYHYFYTTIKSVDPTAKVAIGAISQPSPARMEYLDKVLTHYQAKYRQTFPTDLWNIHFYYLNEEECEWGTSPPPFHSSSELWHLSWKDYLNGKLLDLQQLEINLRNFRRWMAERGYRDIPLIITEYGVLPPPSVNNVYSNENAAYFLRNTVQIFRTVTDTGIISGSLVLTDTATGYPADGNRLVQMWNWYSTGDGYFGGGLFDEIGNLTVIGMAFGYESLSHFTPYVDLEVITPFTPTLVSNTLTWNTFINNRGNITAADTTISSTLINYFSGAVISSSTQFLGNYPPRYIQEPFYITKTWPFASPAAYTMTVAVDAYQTDVVTSNNRVEELFAIYPDLAVISYTNPTIIDWRKDGVTSFVTATVSVSATIANVGNWTSTLTPMAMRLQSSDGAMSNTVALTAPVLAPQGIFTLTQSWIVSNTGVYTASVLVNYPYEPTRELFAYNNISTTQILIPNHWVFLPLIAKNYSVSSTLVITP